MRFYEFEAKKLFGMKGIPLPSGSRVAKTAEEAKQIAAEIDGPAVLKSQVLSGGRMKAGGVLFTETPDEAFAAATKILALEINGLMPVGVLVEGRAAIDQEYYVGVTWDGFARQPVMIFSDMGGIDIEEVAEKHPEHIAKRNFSTLTPFSDYMAKELVASVGVSGSHLNRITQVVKKLANAFIDHSLTLAEINPLARLEDGTFFCLDGHVDMEDEARDGQKRLLADLGIDPQEKRQARPPTKFEQDGVTVDSADHRGVAGNVVEFDGDLGLVIGAGGGSLTLFDAVRKHGGKPANYCEIGGNPSVSKACNLTKLILSKPGVKKIAVMMNVVSNTRVDIVARGVIKGCVELGLEPADKIAIFRIPGSWEGDGFELLKHYGVEYCDRSVSMFEAAGRAVAKMQSA